MTEETHDETRDPGREYPLILSANDEENEAIQASPRIDLNAYHLLWNGEQEPVEKVLRQAEGYFSRPDHGKPVIVSSDGAPMWRAVIREIQDRMRFDGSQHFEHFDRPTNRLQGMRGKIEGVHSFVRWALYRVDTLGRRASRLAPGGRLTRDGNRLLWNGEPITLMGFSLYGMLANTRHDLRAYLDVLHDRGINFTREWCFDQWTALALRGKLQGSGEPGYLTGLSPFVGNSPASLPGTPYDLEHLNDDFFAHLRRFVRLAWERGIVVQVSLFDRHGLRRPKNHPNEPGRWADSPFNARNNRQDFLTIEGPGEHPVAWTGMGGSEIGRVQRAYLQRVVQELRGFGNVILEIMNEPRGTLPDRPTEARWHDWVADVLRSGGGGSGEPRPLAISAPRSQTVYAGDPASFIAIGSGGSGEYSYRWQSWSPIAETWVEVPASPKTFPGHDGPYLDLPEVHPEQDGTRFRCRVRDSAEAEAVSPEALLTVEEEPVDRVWIELGEIDEGRGLRRPPREPGNGKSLPVEIGGRPARRNAEPGRHDRMYFRVDDEWAFAGSRPRVDITVEYFDRGTGFLELQYDGQRSNFSLGERVRLEGSDTWKAHTWRVYDAHFGNRQNHGADLRIFRSRKQIFYLGSLLIDALPRPAPLSDS